MLLARREFLVGLGLAAFAAPTPRTRLILLGTGGGPSPKRLRSAPAQAILVGEDVYVVDCGDGVARQMALAGVALSRIRAVFITHHHSDHDADYGNLLLLGWIDGLRPTVDAYGPPPLARMTELIAEVNRVDIETRIADEGRPPFAGVVAAHEITTSGVVMQQAGVKVTAALVDHPPIRPAFAYRFDTPDRSIVISGDTAPSESLVALAKGAEVLVHEVLYLPGVAASSGTSPTRVAFGSTSSPATRPRPKSAESRPPRASRHSSSPTSSPGTIPRSRMRCGRPGCAPTSRAK